MLRYLQDIYLSASIGRLVIFMGAGLYMTANVSPGLPEYLAAMAANFSL